MEEEQQKEQEKESYSEPIVIKHEALHELTGGKYQEKMTDGPT